MRRAAFLDRDGVINIDPGYVHRIEDFEFVAGTLEACAELVRCGWLLVVVTNQSGIGRGLYTERDFWALTNWMRERFAQAGAPLAGVYFCPHHPTDALDAFRIPCACRKPAPGMLLTAQRELSLDLEQSVLFGDKCEDMQAARTAGVRHRVLLGKDGRGLPVDRCAPSLAQACFASLREAVSSAALAPVLGRSSHV
jgi:D-glycero-D-manno-heptose 1,7-bisphosphate phosphatase